MTLTDAQGMVVDARHTGPDGGYAFSGLKNGEYSGYPPSASALHITQRSGTVRHDIRLRHARAAYHSIDQQVAGQDQSAQTHGIRRWRRTVRAASSQLHSAKSNRRWRLPY